MTLLDTGAHGILTVIASFARLLLDLIEIIEAGLRGLMSGAGLRSDMQSVLMVVLLVVFLFGVLRLLKGRLRLSAALILILVLAHTLEHIAHRPLS